MTIDVQEIVQACDLIARQDNLDVCITESLKGGMVTGICAVACGMIMGPVGIAIGGAVGGAAGCYMSKSYKPLWQILQDMSDQDQVRLSNHMLNVLQRLEITDGIMLMTLIQSPMSSARDTFARELLSYVGTLAIAANANVNAAR